MNRNFRISGAGCTLVDYLYQPVDFSSDNFKCFLSRSSGDGGLTPGKLVFSDEFKNFIGNDYLEARNQITGGISPVAVNIGGPSIVPLIHVAQILYNLPVEVKFYACRGNDDGGSYIERMVAKTPVKLGYFKIGTQYTPFTDVLSDPGYDNGNGERIFINNIGAAGELMPEDLDDSFFESDIIVFGGTALVPNIHNHLGTLLQKAKMNDAITIVNTVYDFLNERKNPLKPWPLGESIDTYAFIDLLIADMEEALRLSGKGNAAEALQFFKSSGVGATIITHGSNPIHFYANHPRFGIIQPKTLPVSALVKLQLKQNIEANGDTTGCGDNFAGGLIAAIAKQCITASCNLIDFQNAIALGVVSGGFACFYHGGTFWENHSGQKAALIEPYLENYLSQISKNLAE